MKSPGDTYSFPRLADTVTVHYEARFKDGAKFDSSWDRGKPFRFVLGVGEVIPGWDEAIPRMSLGELSVLHVPNIQAYGEEGCGDLIPPYADLDFEVHLLKIEHGNDRGLKPKFLKKHIYDQVLPDNDNHCDD